MIERFLATLAQLREVTPDLVGGAGGRERLATWADAVRLQMDCMQAELTSGQRSSLHRLLDALEAEHPEWRRLASSAKRASEAFGG